MDTGSVSRPSIQLARLCCITHVPPAFPPPSCLHSHECGLFSVIHLVPSLWFTPLVVISSLPDITCITKKAIPFMSFWSCMFPKWHSSSRVDHWSFWLHLCVMGAPAGKQSKDPVPQLRRVSGGDVIPAMAHVRAGHRRRVTFFPHLALVHAAQLEKLRFSDRVCSLFSENATRDGAFIF